MNWRKVWTIARTEYLVNVRRAGFLIATAIVPALGLIALILMAFLAPQAGGITRWLEEQIEGGHRPIGIVDESGLFTPILPEYQEFFILYDRPEAAEADLRGDKLQAVLVIGPDYVETGRILVLTREGFGEAVIADSTRVRGFLVAHLLNGRVEPAVQRRAVSPMAQLEARVLSGTGSARSGGFAFTFIIPYFLAIFLVMTIFTSSGYLLQSVAEEKENRVVEILVSSVRPTELMAGKVIGLGALGLTQVLIWLASAWGFSGGAIALMAMTDVASIPIRVLILGVVYYLLGYTLYAMLMAGIGALGTTMRESQQLAGIFSFIAVIPYMMAGVVMMNPNMTIVRVFSFFPLTAPTAMMLRVPLGDVPWVDIVGSIGVLLLSIPVALWLGAKLFRIGLLIYGKRPTMRELWQMLRARA